MHEITTPPSLSASPPTPPPAPIDPRPSLPLFIPPLLHPSSSRPPPARPRPLPPRHPLTNLAPLPPPSQSLSLIHHPPPLPNTPLNVLFLNTTRQVAPRNTRAGVYPDDHVIVMSRDDTTSVLLVTLFLWCSGILLTASICFSCSYRHRRTHQHHHHPSRCYCRCFFRYWCCCSWGKFFGGGEGRLNVPFLLRGLKVVRYIRRRVSCW